jgi:UDP-N-acetylglucosamine 1-carboxyvinyltransferase
LDSFHIHGPARLAGTVRAGGAKNAALPALAASLLAGAPLEIDDAPRVRDLETCDDCSTIRRGEPLRAAIHLDRARRAPTTPLRATTMRERAVLGPYRPTRPRPRLVARRCAIGVRPIDQHLAGLEALGAQVALAHGYVETRAARLVGTRFRFAVPTVTGTENLLMAASLARGTTVLENCAREPEVADLARLLVTMGARVEAGDRPGQAWIRSRWAPPRSPIASKAAPI